jgi:chloramphenicol-sensitive protein RarD
MQSSKHVASGVAAFLIWGFFAIPLRALSDYSAGQILYFRILFSLAILIVVVAGFRRKQIGEALQLLRSFTTRKRWLVILLTLAGGVLLTINWLTFIYIVNNINIKTASFSYLICPVITAVLGSLLLNESLTQQKWLAVALCALSCVLIGLGSALELGYSFLTALTYALYLISQRRNQGFDRMITLAIQVAFSLLVLSMLLPYLLTEVPDTTDFYLIIFIVAAGFTVLPLFLNLFALNKVDAATIGIIMYINPLLNFTIAVTVFGEKLSVIQIVGYATILVALVLFNYASLIKIVRPSAVKN